MTPTIRRLGPIVGAAALLLSLLPSAAGAAGQPAVEVVATGLDNPRGITIAPDGTLLVAEAGRGGDGPCIPGPEGGDFCFGLTGAVTAIAKGKQKRIASGLPSLAEEGGLSAHGPHDLALRGKKIRLVMGLDGADNRTVLEPEGANLGRLLSLDRSGEVRSVADLAAFELENNTDGILAGDGSPEVNSNPFSLLVRDKDTLVVDAGANALLSADKNGEITPLAVFGPRMVPAPESLGLPPGTEIPMQSVPSTVTRGPDGALYVGELTGFPFVPGAARVHRVEPGRDPVVFAEGFTNIIDIAFDAKGRLLVLEISHQGLATEDLTGALIRVEHDGTRTTLLDEGLFAPAGLAVADDGTLYVTNKGVLPAEGEMLRVNPAH